MVSMFIFKMAVKVVTEFSIGLTSTSHERAGYVRASACVRQYGWWTYGTEKENGLHSVTVVLLKK